MFGSRKEFTIGTLLDDLKGRYHLGDVGVTWKDNIKAILRKVRVDTRMSSVLTRVRVGTLVVDSCGQGNEIFSSHNT